MKRRVFSERDVLREGYVDGLKSAYALIAEALGEQRGTTYRATLKSAEIVQTVYGDGEQPETEHHTSWDLSFDFTDSQGFRNGVEPEVGGDDFYVAYDELNKRVVVNWLSDNEWRPLNKKEVADWKSGRINGYNCYLSFGVTVVKDATDDEMLSMFKAI